MREMAQRKYRLKKAINKYVREKKSFSFAEIYEHLNSKRATQVTTASLGGLLHGWKGLSRVNRYRQTKNGYESSQWAWTGEEE